MCCPAVSADSSSVSRPDSPFTLEADFGTAEKGPRAAIARDLLGAVPRGLSTASGTLAVQRAAATFLGGFVLSLSATLPPSVVREIHPVHSAEVVRLTVSTYYDTLG